MLTSWNHSLLLLNWFIFLLSSLVSQLLLFDQLLLDLLLWQFSFFISIVIWQLFLMILLRVVQESHFTSSYSSNRARSLWLICAKLGHTEAWHRLIELTLSFAHFWHLTLSIKYFSILVHMPFLDRLYLSKLNNLNIFHWINFTLSILFSFHCFFF